MEHDVDRLQQLLPCHQHASQDTVDVDDATNINLDDAIDVDLDHAIVDYGDVRGCGSVCDSVGEAADDDLDDGSDDTFDVDVAIVANDVNLDDAIVDYDDVMNSFQLDTMERSSALKLLCSQDWSICAPLVHDRLVCFSAKYCSGGASRECKESERASEPKTEC